MAEKIVSKHLINLEKSFAAGSPVLQKATQVFHELDQLEFDLGLIDQDETTARKTSWWPIISTLGGHSAAKNDFINRYLGTRLNSTSYKYTVHQYTRQESTATLPGTALDADHRLPFYQVSNELEQVKKGEGQNINSYLELMTVNSDALQGKLLVDTPVLGTEPDNPVITLLSSRIIGMSDLVLVFTDLFDAEASLIEHVIDSIRENQDSNKFLYVIDHSEISLNEQKTYEIVSSWQRRLATMGINTGEFVILTDDHDTSIIDRRISQLGADRSYRVLDSLDQSIKYLESDVEEEVEGAISLWKERSAMSTLIVLGLIVMMILIAEVKIGVIDLFFDPIMGPIILFTLLSVIVPTHMILSKVHASFISGRLLEKQKKMNQPENLAGLFEQGLTFWRILLPIKTPITKNKKIRTKIAALQEQCKDLVQSLNDQVTHQQDDHLTTYNVQNDLTEPS